jgi:hypothetical protein
MTGIPENKWASPGTAHERLTASFPRDALRKICHPRRPARCRRLRIQSGNQARLVQEERSDLRMSYYTYPHLRLLLRYSGFTIAEENGSFVKEPISRCHEMIINARKE